jgi:hypothetical protein
MNNHHKSLPIAAALFVLALLFAPHASASETFDVVVGNFCIGDVPVTARQITRTILNNGNTFEDWKITYSAGKKGTKPYIKFLKTSAGSAVDASCRELQGAPVVEGEIVELKLNGRWSAAGNLAAARVSIEANGLFMKIGRVSSGIAPILGGTMDLAGSAAWIVNSVPLTMVEGQPPVGNLEITSWSRRIVGARFVFDVGDQPAPVDLWSGNKNVTIRAAIGGTSFQVIEGKLLGPMPTIRKPQLAFPALSFTDAVLQDGKLAVEGNDQRFTISIENSAIAYASAEYKTFSSTTTIEAGRGTIGSIRGKMADDQAMISFADRTAGEVTLTNASCHLQIAQLQMLETDACEVKIKNAFPSTRAMSISAIAPRQIGLPAIASNGKTSVLFSVSGTDGLDTLSGNLAGFDERLGTALISAVPKFTIPPTALAGSIVEIPVELDVPPGTSSFSLVTADGKVTLTGTLDKLHLHGTIRLDLSKPEIALLVPPQGLQFAASALAALEPVVLNGQTEFAGVGIAFSNITDLEVGTKGSRGKILFKPAATTVLNPNIILGVVPADCDNETMKGCGLTVQAPAKFDLGAEFVIDIRHVDVRPWKGHLSIENANASVDANKPATLGEIRVVDGKLHFDRLRAFFEHGAAFAELIGLDVTARELSSVHKQDGGKLANQLQWSAKNSSLKAGSIFAEASPTRTDEDHLKTRNLRVTDACIESTDAHVGQADALKLAVSKFKLCAATWNDEVLIGTADFGKGFVQGQLADDGGEGEIALNSFHIDITGGPPGSPNGQGNLSLGFIHAVNLNTPIDPMFSCRGEPDFKKIDARTNVDAGAAVLPFTMTNGKPSGQGVAIVVTGKIESIAKYDCTQEILDFTIVGAKRVSLDVPCPTWSEPFRWCTKSFETPAVRIGVDGRIQLYKLEAGIFAADPRLNLGTWHDKTQLKICAGRLTQISPLIAVSYVFQPRTSVPDFNKFIGDLTGILAAPFESALTSGIANSLTGTVSLLRLFDLGTFCN